MFRRIIPNFLNQKYYLTTKHTKVTKVSDIDIFKLLNFVLFVTFVVKTIFSTLVAALPRWVLRGEYSSTLNPEEHLI
jgi:hypothetical protein